MASEEEEKPVAGADGFDFAHREKVATHYQISAKTKYRLKVCIFLHFMLFLLMCAKMLPNWLDRLDIFILEVEELEVPKPNRWEWIWFFSLAFVYHGLVAVRRNRLTSMQYYIFGVFFLSLCPVLYAAVFYFNEMWQYAETRTSEGLHLWQGYPIAVIWYVFVAIAFQVHTFSLYFALQLYLAWKSKGTKKA